MSQNAAPRPWRLVIDGVDETIFDANGQIVHCDTQYYPTGMSTADAQLIVDAVNAHDREWQPIATAPTSTPLLVWHPGLGMGGCNVMSYDGHEWRETANDGRALKAGYEPSHWMRLPSSPQATE